MPGRYGSDGEKYRYGFNGSEKDDEMFSQEGTSYDLGARMYDPRIGRMKSVDPWSHRYPWQTPYAYHRNSPIASIDWKGYGDEPGGFWSGLLDGVQMVIDVVGMIPVAGEIADGVNLLIDIGRGNNVEAGLGLASMIPFVGWAGGAGKIGVRAKKIWDNVSRLWKKKPSTKNLEEGFEFGPLTSGNVITEGGAEIPIVKKPDGDIPEWNGPVDYSDITDHPTVGPGKKYTKTNKEKIIEKNKAENGGLIRSDQDGAVLNEAVQSKKGVKADMNQAEVDHVESRASGGTNSNSNAQILSKEQNLKKGSSNGK